MAKIAVVTDSAACLPPALVKQYGIRVVPFDLIWGDRVFQDGVDLTAAEFYERLQRSDVLPTTSQPSVGEFLKVYQSLVGTCDGVVSIHVPATLTGTVRTAQLAAQEVPELPIRVLDCGTAVMAEGFVVLEAARAAEKGADLDAVIRVAEEMSVRVRLYAILSTLTFLARSGRVPAVAAMLGTALQIQPVFTIRQGKVDIIASVRTNGRAIERILERMKGDARGRPVHAAVFHAGILDDALALHETVADRFDCVELYVTEFTPVMGAHTGPGVLGVAFWADEAG